MFANPEELLRYLKNEGVKFVDVRFCDLPGVMQHFTVPVESFDENVFTDGLAFDGSSIRGFQQIHESDMLLLPDVATAFVDPFRVEKTLALNFFIHDPFTREAYSRDPRNVAKKAETYLASSGIADTAYFGAEAEFYIFDSIRHSTGANEAYYYIDSVEGWWNSGTRGGGRQPRLQDRVQGRATSRCRRSTTTPTCATDGAQPDQPRHHGRAGAPRGRHRRPGRDQLQVLHPAARRRHAAAVQVRREEHRLARRQERDVHAQAALRRQRLRHAHPPEPLAQRRAAVLRRDRLRRPVRHRPLVRRRPAAPRPVAAAPSPTRPSTPTGAWCPASRRRSTWCTRSATARPAPASRSPAPTRRPSGSSSGCRTRRPTRTWPSRPCSWPASTASATRSSRRPRSTRTSTTCRRRRSPR